MVKRNPKETMILTPPDYISIATVQTWYNLGKLILGGAAAVATGYKVVRWFQDIREKDLREIHSGVARLESIMEKQTVALVGELKELRSDIRTFYFPLASQARPAVKPVKKTVKSKSRVKKT